MWKFLRRFVGALTPEPYRGKKVFVAKIISYPGLYWPPDSFRGIFDSKESFFRAVKEDDSLNHIDVCAAENLYRIGTTSGAMYIQLVENEMNKIKL